jgi:hypothetical protein
MSTVNPKSLCHVGKRRSILWSVETDKKARELQKKYESNFCVLVAYLIDNELKKVNAGLDTGYVKGKS